MKLALRLVWFTLMGDIDSLAHHLDFVFNYLPECVGDARANLCQWAWGGWSETLDAIEEAYNVSDE
jgi:hypothetical protein